MAELSPRSGRRSERRDDSGGDCPNGEERSREHTARQVCFPNSGEDGLGSGVDSSPVPLNDVVLGHQVV
jgi:hypothetical protein